MPLDFGIELECLVPGRDRTQIGAGLADRITAAGVHCIWETYSHRVRDHWKIVYDNSLSPPDGYAGLEVVSPPMTDARLHEIETVCRVLKENHVRVNRSCGFHVHIGAAHMGVQALKKLAFLFIENEEVFDSLMPGSRRASNNTYCQSLKGRANINALEAAQDVVAISRAICGQANASYGDGTRYMKLNFLSYVRQRTVEFRQHSGTIDAEKIIRWIQFCQKLVDVAVATASIPNVPPQIENDRALQARLQRARKSRVVYELAQRPEGVTALEMQAALGTSTAASPAIPLERLGVQYRIDGRRRGHKVYKLALVQPVLLSSTLDTLIEKIGMTPEEAAFWRQRRELLLTHFAESSLPEIA